MMTPQRREELRALAEKFAKIDPDGRVAMPVNAKELLLLIELSQQPAKPAFPCGWVMPIVTVCTEGPTSYDWKFSSGPNSPGPGWRPVYDRPQPEDTLLDKPVAWRSYLSDGPYADGNGEWTYKSHGGNDGSDALSRSWQPLYARPSPARAVDIPGAVHAACIDQLAKAGWRSLGEVKNLEAEHAEALRKQAARDNELIVQLRDGMANARIERDELKRQISEYEKQRAADEKTIAELRETLHRSRPCGAVSQIRPSVRCELQNGHDGFHSGKLSKYGGDYIFTTVKGDPEAREEDKAAVVDRMATRDGNSTPMLQKCGASDFGYSGKLTCTRTAGHTGAHDDGNYAWGEPPICGDLSYAGQQYISSCVLRQGHTGRHQDFSGKVWGK